MQGGEAQLRSGQLICFIGTDGSGKSTLAEHIFKVLSGRGWKVRKTYGRHKPVFSRILIAVGKRVFLSKSDILTDYDEYLSNKRDLYEKKSRLISIYINLILVEYFFQVLFKITIPCKLGYAIVADRYVYDTIINDIAIDKGLPLKSIDNIISKFFGLIPRPDHVFLVSVSEDVALRRKNDIPSLSYLKIRNSIYSDIAAMNGIRTLDGTRTIDFLTEQVLEHLGEKT
jgi:thymidylate kinase